MELVCALCQAVFVGDDPESSVCPSCARREEEARNEEGHVTFPEEF